MKIRFIDHKGSKDTILFNPQYLFFRDGSLIVFPGKGWQGNQEFDLPMYAGEVKELWVDMKQGIYSPATTGSSSPGTLRVLWIKNGEVNMLRYKEDITRTLKDAIMEIIF